MRIGFDVSLLARGARGAIRGGGLGRVVGEIAAALHRRRDLEVACFPMDHGRFLPVAAEVMTDVPVWQGRFAQKRVFRILGGMADGNVVGLNSLSRRLRNLLDSTWRPGVPPGIDLLHSPFDPIRAPLRRRLPHLLTIADLIPITMPQHCEEGFVRWFREVHLPQVGEHSWIHCISEEVRSDLLHAVGKLDPAKVRTVHLGRGPAFHPGPSRREEVARTLGLPDVPWICTLSTIEARKNLETVVRGFLEACGDPSFTAHLLVVGGAGWKTGALERALSEAGEASCRIHVTGYVPEESLPELLRACLAFVSMSRAEGFGLPPLEAMACGIPVVLSDIPAHREVAGEAALFLDVDDVARLAATLRSVVRDEQGLAGNREAGLRRADELTWTRCAGELASLYREILEDRAWKR